MLIRDKQQFVDRLEKHRQKKGLSIRKMCEPTGLAHTVWVRYLSGDRQPSWDVLFEIAKVFNIKIEIHAKYRK